MKKIILTLFMLFRIFYSCFAGQNFSLSPAISYQNEIQGEYVFYKYADDNDALAKLSQLDWMFPEVFSAGLDFETAINRIFWSAGFSIGVPVLLSGIMTDSDWKNVTFLPNGSLEKAAIKTNYTESKTRLNAKLSACGKFAYTFLNDDFASLNGFAELEYNFTSATALGLNGKYARISDGYYTSWEAESSSKIYYPESTKTVGFDRHWFISWIGFETKISFPKKLNLEFSLAVSPAAFGISIDNHYLRSLIFVDLIYGFFNAGKISGLIGWNITKHDSINLGADLRGSLILKGTSFLASTSDYKFAQDLSDIPGADFKSFEITLSYKRKF